MTPEPMWRKSSHSSMNGNCVEVAAVTARDKRDQCGCHRDCTVLPHQCATPCRWPRCLTAAETRELARDITSDPDL